jgi:phage tail-like protein
VDVNGTRFHLVLGKGDWFPQPETCVPDENGKLPGHPCAEWDDATSTVGLTREAVVFPRRSAEQPPADTDRRGAGRDRFGNWYWIDADGRSIVARTPRDAQPVPFWPHPAAEPAPPAPADGDFAPVDPPPSPPPPRLQGLAVTTEHYLVVGNLDEPGLLVFDLASGGPPVAIRWPAGVPLAPWDICAAPDGGAWVLDRDNARLWALDRLFRVREAGPSPLVPHEPEFEPVDPPEDDPTVFVYREGPITLAASVDVSVVTAPTAVEVLCDGSALVLGRDGAGPVVHRFTLEDGWTFSRSLATALAGWADVLHDLPYGHEFAFVPADGCSADAMDGQLFVVAPDGNQSFAFTLSAPVDELKVVFDPRFFPMRRFGGRALVTAGGEAHYDSGEKWVSLLEYPRPNFSRVAILQLPVAGGGSPGPGEAPVHAFDGREPGCVWHRLFLDGCIPPESSVTIESRAADEIADLEATPWSVEPAPYLRSNGPELPYVTTCPPGPEGQAGTWELLFQNAVGRWLQLRVTLTGNGRITPRLRAIRAYYPRFSYLRQYLPAVYREDAGSAWFMDRYLANVEGGFTGIEDHIAAAQVLFDPRTVPPEFLEWLAGWMGAALDASWSERKKRIFLAHAMEMFAGRGTREGLIRALRLALEDCVDPHLFDQDGETELTVPTTSTAAMTSTASGSSSSTSSTAVTKVAKAGDCGCGCGGSGGCGGGSGATHSSSARFTVRVVEQFLTRDAPGVAFGDVGGLAGPGTTTTALEWTPAQGAEPLHTRWREWLATQYADIDALKKAWGIATEPTAMQGLVAQAMKKSAAGGKMEITVGQGLGAGFEMTIPIVGVTLPEDEDYDSFADPRLKLPATAPKNTAKAADWTRFLREGLGFTWAVPDSQGDLQLWRDFLARRYGQPGDLARAWGVPKGKADASFTTVAYPAALPEQNTALADWITFVSVVVPMRRTAHRFTVLVPVNPGDDRETQRQRRELARRIALLEKPAHTVLETRLYWAAFRVGEARLGADTLLGQGSRFTSLVLDRGELAGSYLDWTEPWNVRGRLVVGRDPVTAGPQPAGSLQRWT